MKSLQKIAEEKERELSARRAFKICTQKEMPRKSALWHMRHRPYEVGGGTSDRAVDRKELSSGI